MAYHRHWEILAEIINRNNLRSAIEVGVFKGKNLEELCSRCPQLKITGVDSWKNLDNISARHFSNEQHMMHYRQAMRVVSRYPGRVKLEKRTSAEYAKLVPDESVDFIFIDGDHGYEGCFNDILSWLSKVKIGGFITGHDYMSPKFPGVTEAVNEVFGVYVDTYSMTGELCKVWVHHRC